MGVPTPRGLTKVKNSCERPTMKASDWLNMCCDKNLGSDWPEAFDLSSTFVFRPLRQAPTLILPDGWEDYAPLVPRTILALKSKPESTPKLVLPAPVMEIPKFLDQSLIALQMQFLRREAMLGIIVGPRLLG